MFGWKQQSAKAVELAAEGTPNSGVGFSSAKAAALAASRHPCYLEGVARLQQRVRRTGGHQKKRHDCASVAEFAQRHLKRPWKRQTDPFRLFCCYYEHNRQNRTWG